MKILPVSFHRDGYDFTQVIRQGNLAIYSKTKPHYTRPSFEVVIVQQHPAETICGRIYQERESMPPSEAWGTAGWTCTTLEDAKIKLRTLVESRQEAIFHPAATPAGALSSGRTTRKGGSATTRRNLPQP